MRTELCGVITGNVTIGAFGLAACFIRGVGQPYTGATLPISVENSSQRVAYLLSRYPAISHTFFLKEVLGMRQRGLKVLTASINPADRPVDELPPVEAEEAGATFYIKAGGTASMGLKVLAVALKNPGVALRGLRAALSLGKFDLLARAYALFYLAEALLVGDWMRRNRLPHLHVHFGGAVATVGMLTAQAWQVPWSVTLHGPDEFFDQEDFYLRQKIESAAFVVCISDFCRSQVLRIAPAHEAERLEVVRLGVDCQALQPSAGDREPGPVRLVCTGRMVSAKGHRILLEALAPLVASGVEMTCTLIGDGPERKDLEAMCAAMGIAAQVRFLGAMAHGPTLAEVAKADIFVLASFAEGLPVALMEAMALGVPCVSTTIAAIPELIRDGQNGLLVPPSNPEALREALQRLVADEDLRREFGKAARETAAAEYNLSTNLDLLAGVFWKRLN